MSNREGLEKLAQEWLDWAYKAPDGYGLVASRVRDKFVPELRRALLAAEGTGLRAVVENVLVGLRDEDDRLRHSNTMIGVAIQLLERALAARPVEGEKK